MGLIRDSLKVTAGAPSKNLNRKSLAGSPNCLESHALFQGRKGGWGGGHLSSIPVSSSYSLSSALLEEVRR